MPRTRLFRAGTYLAVLANNDYKNEDNDHDKYWVCCTKTDVYVENDKFSIVWLEKVSMKIYYSLTTF